MNDLMRYAADLEGAGGKSLPPVHLWNPEFCGDINLVIKRDGTWFYEGTPIGRARLVRLFSTVLKREGGQYFLVTPVEKLGIIVEDTPFVAVLMRTKGDGEGQTLYFTTNVGDEVCAGADHKLVFRKDDETDERAPYIEVRAGLEARVARSVFYDLVELGETKEIEGSQMFGVWSGGEFFPFSPAEDVFE
ncbi:MAG: hypothetical protein DHS20C05_22980 [Hyphococcus sp.]|nr:MAG: hypothetical protein DHS20C05_22980 [Marinicaulis sp.]